MKGSSEFETYSYSQNEQQSFQQVQILESGKEREETMCQKYIEKGSIT